MDLGFCPSALRRRFYQTYRDDQKMTDVSAFLCLHATSMCQLYMPFGKPLIAIAR